jgi:beta-ribofuranosylaminobenzene 5'-phosphate synthase
MTVTIQAHPRLHLTLIDLGGVTERKYGGAGVTLSGPLVRVTARPSHRMHLGGLDQLDERGRVDVEGAIGRLMQCETLRPCELSLDSAPPQHVGLGTKTSILLSFLVALARASGVSIDVRALQRLSARGGVSGIGVHGFFAGGYLVDAGHERATSEGFAPSSARTNFRIPPLATRLPIPDQWRFQLVIPRGRRIAGGDESELFKRLAPIPEREVYQILGHVYHGLTPAFAEADLPLLRHSLSRVHSIGFKCRELHAQHDNVLELYRSLLAIETCAVGMSSLGPLLYTVTEQEDHPARSRVEAICREHQGELLGTVCGTNKGFLGVDDNDH